MAVPPRNASMTPIAGFRSMPASDVLDSMNALVIDINKSLNAISTAAAPGVVPVNTILPMVSGTPQVGQILTATTGTWTNAPTSYTYQWNRSGAPIMPITGATASLYVPVVADVGMILTVTVVAINSAGQSVAATSAGIGPIAPAAPTGLGIGVGVDVGINPTGTGV